MDPSHEHQLRNLLTRCEGPLHMLLSRLEGQPECEELVKRSIRALEALEQLLTRVEGIGDEAATTSSAKAAARSSISASR